MARTGEGQVEVEVGSANCRNTKDAGGGHTGVLASGVMGEDKLALTTLLHPEPRPDTMR